MLILVTLVFFLGLVSCSRHLSSHPRPQRPQPSAPSFSCLASHHRTRTRLLVLPPPSYRRPRAVVVAAITLVVALVPLSSSSLPCRIRLHSSSFRCTGCHPRLHPRSYHRARCSPSLPILVRSPYPLLLFALLWTLCQRWLPALCWHWLLTPYSLWCPILARTAGLVISPTPKYVLLIPDFSRVPKVSLNINLRSRLPTRFCPLRLQAASKLQSGILHACDKHYDCLLLLLSDIWELELPGGSARTRGAPILL